jgi:ceramide kinase
VLCPPALPAYLNYLNFLLGIIPAGSTDTIAYCLHGTTDIKTCIIHIILGQVSGFDISSISSDKGLIKFYASVVAYGFLGDISFDQENYRYLGPRRYEWVGFKKVLLNRGYDIEVLIQQDKAPSPNGPDPEDNDCDKIKCCENCGVCSIPPKPTVDVTKSSEEEKFKKITGRFFMVNMANISCACQRSPSGMSPYCHLGDGYNDIILVRHGGRLQNIRFLLKLSSKKGQIADFDFVELYKTKKVYFKALNSTSEGSLNDSTQPISNLAANKYTSVWNCDGEIVQDTDVTMR